MTKNFPPIIIPAGEAKQRDYRLWAKNCPWSSFANCSICRIRFTGSSPLFDLMVFSWTDPQQRRTR